MRDHRYKRSERLNVHIFQDTYYALKRKCRELQLSLEDVVQLILDEYFGK